MAVDSIPDVDTVDRMWIDVDGRPVALYVVELGLACCGIEVREARRLAEALERRRGIVVQEQRVREWILFESLLGPGGAQHVPLATFPLRGA